MDFGKVLELRQAQGAGLFENEGEMLTTVDVGRIFNVSPQVVRDWCRRGVIPSVKVGRRVYVPRNSLAEQMQRDLCASVNG